jgi:SAM-dependent methyltransferase
MADQPHGSGNVSPWIRRWSHLVPDGGAVLDLACGQGRHVRWFAARGHPVVAVDRSRQALDAMSDLTTDAVAPLVQTVLADIENQAWPLTHDGIEQTFDAVIVTNYLWRPLAPAIVACVAPGGVLIHETFAAGNETVGKPSRPDFLLRPGELLEACSGLRVVAYEDGFLDEPERFVQRIAAVREVPGASPVRYSL